MNPKEMSKRAKDAEALADLIKSTQKSLRTKSFNKNDNEVRELWLKHTQNKELLQEYATAMHTLATEHWEGSTLTDRLAGNKNVSRINWIFDSIKEYFFGDALKIKLEKEERRVSHLEPKSLDNFLRNASSVTKRYESLEKLKVLDVGSCFNPFGKFDELEVTPIDLHPATSEVYKCDFLCLKVTTKDVATRKISDVSQEDSEPADQQDRGMEIFSQKIKRQKIDTENDYSLSMNNDCEKDEISDPNCKIGTTKIPISETQETNDLNDSCNKVEFKDTIHELMTSEEIVSSEEKDGNYEIKELKESSFDVVIFSFFLGYIPTAKLRFECCLKAFKLLKPSGILCIVTPDSHHLTGNILLFKLWKSVLALIGFERVKYEKCDHFHAMMFRRALVPSTLKEHAEMELKSLETKQYFAKFSINWPSIRNSIYIIQDLSSLKKNTDK